MKMGNQEKDTAVNSVDLTTKNLTITNLCERFNVTPRTIYYYMSIGLLPPAGSRGQRANYTEEFAQKLDEVLKLRGKMKLSAMLHGNAKNYNIESSDDRTVIVIHMDSNSNSFLQYAYSAIQTKAVSCSAEFNGLITPDSSKAMAVIFPVDKIAFHEIDQVIARIKAHADENFKDVRFTASLSSKPFSVNITEKVYV